MAVKGLMSVSPRKIRAYSCGWVSACACAMAHSTRRDGPAVLKENTSHCFSSVVLEEVYGVCVFVCVCVGGECVSACVRACVRACARVCVCV